jgi:hypothetical protein
LPRRCAELLQRHRTLDAEALGSRASAPGQVIYPKPARRRTRPTCSEESGPMKQSEQQVSELLHTAGLFEDAGLLEHTAAWLRATLTERAT